MFESLRLWFRLRGLRSSIRITQRIFAKKIIEARATKHFADELQRLRDEEGWKIQLYDEQIAKLLSDSVVAQAREYDVPVPPWNGLDWEDLHQIGGRALSAQGRHALRAKIRAEKNDRWTYWQMRLGLLITGTTGLVGTLIGLFATLK